MTQRKQTGRWTEFADSKGIDAKYAEEELEAQRQLTEATAGPGKDNVQSCVAGPIPSTVPAGDTEMKNPAGSFAAPSPYKGPHIKDPHTGRPKGPAN